MLGSNGNAAKNENQKKADHLDLVTFVSEIEKFNRLIEPLSFIFYSLEDVRRWRNPGVSLAVWITLNLGCLILSKGAVFVLASFVVIAIVTCALVQNHTGLLTKFLPSTGNEDLEWSEDEFMADGSIRTVRQFRFSVIQMFDFIQLCNENLVAFYNLLTWDAFGPSLIFHIELCTLVIGSVVFPTRGLCFIIINMFFLASEETIKMLHIKGLQLICQLKGNPCPVVEEDKCQQLYGPKIASPEDLVSENTSSGLIQESDEDELDGSMTENLLSETGSTTSTRASGMVARLKEMKKKRQHLVKESCFKCGISFSSLFKRRCYCRHCGNNFCAKCCNQKVPKAMFGATSPTAQTETVPVCQTCHSLLTQSSGKPKKS